MNFLNLESKIKEESWGIAVLCLIGEIIDPYYQILLPGNNLEGKKIVFAVENHGGGAFDNIHIFSLGKCLGIGRRHFNNI